MAAPAETIDQIRTTVIDLALKFGPKVLAALVILTIGYLVGRQVSRWLERALMHLEMEPPVRSLVVRIARIALAMQGLLSNLFAGLSIIFTRPFRVGEYIGIVGEILHNYGKIRQVDVTVGVAYDTERNQALTVIQEVLRENARVIQDMTPVIGVRLLADSSINIAVKPWVAVQDYGPAGGEINKSILEAFREHGIVIPYPQREVRLVQDAA